MDPIAGDHALCVVQARALVVCDKVYLGQLARALLDRHGLSADGLGWLN